MGTGGIAATMAETLRAGGATISAVGSARPGAAETFAGPWAIPHALSSHRAVAEHDDVDIVYVATTNEAHHRNVLDSITAGKPVLCEKPLALNGGQARAMLEAGRRANVLVVEAMWMSFLPFLSTMDRLIARGEIGEPLDLQASFGFPMTADPDRRWLNRHLGGGTLIDMGVYPLTLAHHLLGDPDAFDARARLGPTGVDLHTQVTSHHPGGTSASVTVSFLADLTGEAVLAGTEGRVRLHAPFHHTSLMTLERRGEVVASHDTSHSGHGFRFQVAEMERCVRDGLTESQMRPHADTLAVMDWMDEIRARCGVVYTADRP